MSSSTFSSRHEWKVLLVVALALIACELGTRVIVQRFDDVIRREEMPKLVANLQAEPAPRIIFLGNSLTREGVNPKSFNEQLSQHGIQIGGECKLCADSTTLRQWELILDREVLSAEGKPMPDCVVIGYIGNHLTDQAHTRWHRMALNTEGVDQVAEVLSHDVTSIEDGAYFLAAHYLAAVGYQEEVKAGVLHRILPHYRRETQRLNRERQLLQEDPQDSPSSESPEAPRHTYEELQRFLQKLKERKIHTVICLMPVMEEQYLDPQVVALAAESGATLFDFRGLSPELAGHFPDGLHMDKVAADIYSRRLADKIAQELPEVLTAPVNASGGR